MRDEFGQLTRGELKLEDKVARIRHECNLEVKDVHFESGRLQVRLDLPASQFLGLFCSLTAAPERLEQHL